MILDAVRQRIVANPAWHKAVLDETLAAWKEQAAQCPDEIQTTEKTLAEVDRKIARLVDSIENGNDSPEIKSRLYAKGTPLDVAGRLGTRQDNVINWLRVERGPDRRGGRNRHLRV